ncbi:MAG: SRPBCC family protein [Acidimicrobiaceae bacterium]
MKLSDTPRADVEILINAPVEKVWPLISDPDLPAKFSEEFQGAVWLDGATPSLGAKFKGTNKMGESVWDTTSTITDFLVNEVFEWTVEDLENPVSIWSFRLSPSDGSTLLKMSGVLGTNTKTGLHAAIAKDPENEEKIVGWRMSNWRENMMKTVEGIKQLSEK